MPIALSSHEWARISKWADLDKEDPDVVRRRELLRKMDETSKKMAKDWPNSVENVNKRNEEQRRERIEAAEQANNKFYKKYLKRKKEEQQRLMYSARDTVFKNKDAPKLLLSAVIETVIQKERQIQLEFLNQQRQREKEQKRKDDDDVIQKAKDWHQLQAERRRRRFQVNKEHQRDILDQAEEISEKARSAYEEEMRLQKIDNTESSKQMAIIKEFDDAFKAAEKARIWSDMERSRQELEARRRGQKARDTMDDQLIEVLTRSRARVEEKRKQTEKEAKDEKCRIIDNISKRLESGDAAREAADQANLNKAIKEKEALDDARLAALAAKEEKNRQQRRESRRQYLRGEEQRLHEVHTMQQWDIMNRFKNNELYKDFQEKLRQDKQRKIKEFRSDTIRLRQERQDREARERAETRYFYGELAERKTRDADNKLLTHAVALVEEAKANGRPARPLLRALDRYCKMYRLYPMPDLPKSMKEHFQRYAPWDGSKPDPWYKEAPAPPADRGPDAPDLEDTIPEGGQRDGLQPLMKQEKIPQPASKGAADDYKRLGRANGMQQRRDAMAKDEKCRIIDNISKRLESGDAAREAADQANLNKAIKEKEALDDARLAALAAKEEKNRQQRRESRRQYLRGEEQRLHEVHTMQQWDIMNRFKNNELYKDFQEKLRQDKQRKIKEFRSDTIRLRQERQDREARERAETRYFYGELAERKTRDADNKLLTHAVALVEEAKANGRPARPILRALDRYCKMYRLYPMPDLPKSMKEHFQRYAPWDGSKPDPWYKEAPAPPADRGPDAPDLEDTIPEGGKRDGLQPVMKQEKIPQPASKGAADDYKRQGRANGMQQRRDAMQDLTLPPITVVPCHHPDCDCELKQ